MAEEADDDGDPSKEGEEEAIECCDATWMDLAEIAAGMELGMPVFLLANTTPLILVDNLEFLGIFMLSLF